MQKRFIGYVVSPYSFENTKLIAGQFEGFTATG